MTSPPLPTASSLSHPESSGHSGNPDDSLTDLAIVGGGISGLALAAFAVRSGLSVAVFEASARPGGVMDSFREEGFLFERGPNTVLDRDPSLNELVQWAGLEDRTIKVPMRGMQRYIWHAGRLHPVPSSPVSALTSRLLSVGGKLRVLREPWIAPKHEDEPLRDFAIRRLGREAYDRALVPMVSGISGGDPTKMSTEFSFPVLKELERKGGGLFRGMLARRKESGAKSRPGLNMVSFPDGLGELPRAIERRLGEVYRLDAPVRSIEPLAEGGGFRIEVGDEVYQAAHIALSAHAQGTADCIEPIAPEVAARLRAVLYCPLAVLGLGVEASSLHLPEGFGFLTTADSGLRILGTIFNSAFFEGRAPRGSHLLTVMLGSDRDPQAVEMTDEELFEQVRLDLGRALGWNGKALISRVVRWDGAIPQYTMDHAELLASLDHAEASLPGLHFFGNWRGGAAVGERIRLASELAGKISRKKAEKSS